MPSIKRFSFIFLFFVKSITSPSPAPAHNPATKLPKLSTPLKNSSQNSTLTAQLGTSPISATRRGWNMLLATNILEIFSIPIRYTAMFIITDASKR